MIPLKDKQARELSTQVAKQSTGVSVKLGRTNGRPVLHLIQHRADDAKPPREAESFTIASEAEWAAHPWNRHNQPKPKKKIDGLDEAIANKEAQ